MISAMNERDQHEEKTLEAFLIQAMRELQLSIVALARGAGIAKQTIHAYLNGTRPTLENCRKLAFFLGEVIGLVYPDVESKRLDSLVETYLRLPEYERQLSEGIMFWLAQNAKQQQEK
ncbi:MAG TPA: helix-turn-helix transcriptional regulator [Ktedonobacteraceae bacterium]|nr:helix-turn-helix transcriptional regulator [Ktedonobacteraceae bacterium]